MVVVGVVLVLLAAAAGVLLVVATGQLTDTVDIPVLGGTLSVPPLTLLVTGMVVITLFWLGWALLRGGVRRGKRRRVEAKEAATAAEARRLEQERLLHEERAARAGALPHEHRPEPASSGSTHDEHGSESHAEHGSKSGAPSGGVAGDPATAAGGPRTEEARPVESQDTPRP